MNYNDLRLKVLKASNFLCECGKQAKRLRKDRKMDKMLIGIVVIALIVNCQLALATDTKVEESVKEQMKEIDPTPEGLPKVIETVKAVKDIITGDKPELDEKTKEAMADLKPVYKEPQDVLDRMIKPQNQILLLQKDLQIINAKLEGLNLARQDEFWLWLTSIGVTREELPYWSLNKGMATRN